MPAIVMKASAATPIPDLETFSKSIIKLHMQGKNKPYQAKFRHSGLQLVKDLASREWEPFHQGFMSSLRSHGKGISEFSR